MDLTLLLTKYGWLVQLAGVVAFGLLVNWMAARSKPRAIAAWTYSRYQTPVKLLAAIFPLFMTAALVYNGTALFREDWWVPPAIIVMTVLGFWLAHDVFLTTLRWNDDRFEIFRFPLRPKSIRLEDITSIKHHALTESVSIIDSAGNRVWFSCAYRVGIGDLMARIQSIHDQPEA